MFFGLIPTNGTRERAALDAEIMKLESVQVQAHRKLVEANILSLNAWVDPRDAFTDEHGNRWDIISVAGGGMNSKAEDQIISPQNDGELKTMRVTSRILVERNEFARNAVDNLIDYVVGFGMSYQVQVRKQMDVGQDIVDIVHQAVAAFLEQTDFGTIERECVRRAHRDGEFFLRRFVEDDQTSLRFIEPADIAAPDGSHDPADSFGIRTSPDDVQEPVDYFHAVEKRWIPAEEIVHGKLNVDMNSKRGKPTFYPLRKRIEAALETVDFMHLLIRLQGSIGLIRTHESATKSQVTDFQTDHADVQATDAKTGRDRFFGELRGPKTIDIPSGMGYEFPATTIKAKDWVDVVQATIRTTAAALRLPEWMLTARLDAKFANAFASESPFVRMIQGQQNIFGRLFREIIQDAVAVVLKGGETGLEITAARPGPDGETEDVPTQVWDALKLQVEPPTIEVRDAKKDAEANSVLRQADVLSRRTWAARAGLDYDDEQANIEDEQMAIVDRTPDPFAGIGDEEEGEDDQDQQGSDEEDDS